MSIRRFMHAEVERRGSEQRAAQPPARAVCLERGRPEDAGRIDARAVNRVPGCDQ